MAEVEEAVVALRREAATLSSAVAAAEEGVVAALRDVASEPTAIRKDQWEALGRKLNMLEVRRAGYTKTKIKIK